MILNSLNAPELVFGDEPVVLRPAALANWFWGGLATVFVLRSTVFRRPQEMGWGETDAWPWVFVVVSGLWVVALLASLLAPDLVIDEQITIPIATIVAPPIATVFTLYAAEFLITGFAARKPLTAGGVGNASEPG